MSSSVCFSVFGDDVTQFLARCLLATGQVVTYYFQIHRDVRSLNSKSFFKRDFMNQVQAPYLKVEPVFVKQNPNCVEVLAVFFLEHFFIKSLLSRRKPWQIWYNLNISKEKLNSVQEKLPCEKSQYFFPVCICHDNLEVTYFSKDFLDQYTKSGCEHELVHLFKIVSGHPNMNFVCGTYLRS